LPRFDSSDYPEYRRFNFGSTRRAKISSKEIFEITMLDPTPHLDLAEKLVRIFGWPSLVGVVIWLVRTFDASNRKLTDIDKHSKAAFDTVVVVQAQVDTMQSNHMAHMQDELKGQTVILASMDKNIGILVDRTPRA
jgi:hypothetical protein